MASWTLACSGSVAALLGLAEAGRGFATGSIEVVAGGVTFMLCAGFASLVGMLGVGFPLQDRATLPPRANGKWLTASRLAWYGLPLVCLFALVVTMLLVVVPMVKPEG